VTRCIVSRSSWYRRVWCRLACAALPLVLGTLHPQLSAQTLSATGQADQCSGPLGALLPECPAKSSMDVASTLRMRGSVSADEAAAADPASEASRKPKSTSIGSNGFPFILSRIGNQSQLSRTYPPILSDIDAH
jgi:hypothetical protein